MRKKNLIVLSLALALPSIIIGVVLVIVKLISEGYLDTYLGILIFIAILGAIFFRMIKNAS